MSVNIDLYLPSGYLNMQGIIDLGFPFTFIPAARGTGKTYGTCEYATINKEEIILLRRTQNEIDLQNDPKGDGTSFYPVYQDLGHEHHVTRSKNIGHVFDDTDQRPAAVNVALSTFANIRGSFDFSHIKKVFYDECIAEPHVKKIKNEGMAFANFYESCNRNRELKNEKPLQAIMAANSVNIANDLFMYFDIVSHAEEMISNLEEVRVINNKLLIIPQNSPISKKKQKTALYQATVDEFSEMAINNKFILNDFSYVQKRSLREYRCIFKIGDLYFFQHKSRDEFYVTFKKGQTKEVYAGSYSGLEKARRDKWRYPGYYMDGMIRFESYRCIALFEKYFNMA